MYNTINAIKCQESINELGINRYDRLQKIIDKMQIKDSLIKYYKPVIQSPIQFKAISECGSFLEIDKEMHIYKANFCRNRMCPVCNMRKSQKQWLLINNYVEGIVNQYDFIFITLTVKNCAAEMLSKTLDQLSHALQKLVKLRKWKRAIKGYIRGTEITFNSTEHTYHPHIHMICAVSKDYFVNPDLYISQQELKQWWENANNILYHSQVHIEKIDEKERTNAIAEVSKYALKMADLLCSKDVDSDRIKYTKILYDTVRNRRLMSTAGIFANRYLKAALDNTSLLDETEQEKPTIKLSYNKKSHDYKRINN